MIELGEGLVLGRGLEGDVERLSNRGKREEQGRKECRKEEQSKAGHELLLAQIPRSAGIGIESGPQGHPARTDDLDQGPYGRPEVFRRERGMPAQLHAPGYQVRVGKEEPEGPREAVRSALVHHREQLFRDVLVGAVGHRADPEEGQIVLVRQFCQVDRLAVADRKGARPWASRASAAPWPSTAGSSARFPRVCAPSAAACVVIAPFQRERWNWALRTDNWGISITPSRVRKK